MLDHLLNGVLPFFAIGALGYVLGKRGTFDFALAMAINKYVMFVSMPALAFGLMAHAPLEEFDLAMLGGYLGTEVVMYVSGFVISRYVFGADVKEAVLLGLALALTNHVLFVLPIATTLFGESAVTPIVAIISMDGILVFSGTIIMMDVLASRGTSFAFTLGKIFRNPPVIAILLGTVVGLLNIPIPKGIDVFLTAVGGTASPVLLFALGVILSQPQNDRRTVFMPAAMTGMKLLVHPLLAFGIFTGLLSVSPQVLTPAMMVAAAPCGVMAFMLALNYGVRVDAIARIIFFTSIGSLLTVTLAAGL